MIDAFNEILQEYGFALTFRDICEMFYDQGYIDTFEHSFDEYYEAIFGREINHEET